MSNTIFEGGYYLVFTWMGFRIFVVLLAVFTALSIKRSNLFLSAAACTGYIITFGLSGTLGIQPPMAIWFWLAIGNVMVLRQYDRYFREKDVEAAKLKEAQA